MEVYKHTELYPKSEKYNYKILVRIPDGSRIHKSFKRIVSEAYGRKNYRKRHYEAYKCFRPKEHLLFVFFCTFYRPEKANGGKNTGKTV
jgi:hypothetical protein